MATRTRLPAAEHVLIWHESCLYDGFHSTLRSGTVRP